MGTMVWTLLIGLQSAVVEGQSYRINRHPTTAANRNEAGNNRYAMSGSKRELVTVMRDGTQVWQFICIDDCQRWSDTQLVRRAVFLRAHEDKRK